MTSDESVKLHSRLFKIKWSLSPSRAHQEAKKVMVVSKWNVTKTLRFQWNPNNTHLENSIESLTAPCWLILLLSLVTVLLPTHININNFPPCIRCGTIIMFRGWAFLAPALVMIVVGIIIYFFLVTGENWPLSMLTTYTCTCMYLFGALIQNVHVAT